MFDESKHPRDERGRFTDGSSRRYAQNMSYAEIVREDRKSEFNSGAQSGAIDPNSKRGEEHAARYYEEIRHRKDDVPAISKNTGLPIETVEKIKQYIFIDKHNLENGFKRFYPDCDMAISWQRLIMGNYIEPDIVMLQHEIMEMALVEKGMNQKEAHNITNKKYNYSKAIKDWREENGSNKKHK